MPFSITRWLKLLRDAGISHALGGRKEVCLVPALGTVSTGLPQTYSLWPRTSFPWIQLQERFKDVNSNNKRFTLQHSLHQLQMWGSHTLEQYIAVKNHASISIKVRNKTNTPTRTTTRNIFLEFPVNTRETPEEWELGTKRWDYLYVQI